MSTQHPTITSKELIRILERKGFRQVRQNGSHAIFRDEEGRRTTVPVHGKKALGIGLLKQFMKDAELTIEDLKNS